MMRGPFAQLDGRGGKGGIGGINSQMVVMIGQEETFFNEILKDRDDIVKKGSSRPDFHYLRFSDLKNEDFCSLDIRNGLNPEKATLKVGKESGVYGVLSLSFCLFFNPQKIRIFYYN